MVAHALNSTSWVAETDGSPRLSLVYIVTRRQTHTHTYTRKEEIKKERERENSFTNCLVVTAGMGMSVSVSEFPFLIEENRSHALDIRCVIYPDKFRKANTPWG